MVQEAEANAEEDRKRREAIHSATTPRHGLPGREDAREHGDRIPSEMKMELDTKVAGGQGDPREGPRERRPAATGLRRDGAVADQGRTSMYEQAGAAGADMAPTAPNRRC